MPEFLWIVMPLLISETPYFLQFPSGAAFQESLAHHLPLLPFCLMNILLHLLQTSFPYEPHSPFLPGLEM